ncbi:MAG: cytochrome ubiquinol oxidase subunit I [Thermodesulfobacteriota bacterium]
MLSRLQFALTTMFHISWAAMSVGLSLMLVVMEGLWLKTGDDAYYHHTRFWGKFFLLNFAVGVVSGVPLEFQFGTNWGKFSAATGGFFGNILGFETVLAFMLEAGFLGIMLFGWNRVSRKAHFFATCMVALGASLSAFWIMVANSWMQTPSGGHWDGSRYISTSFWAGLFNPDMPWGVTHMWVACIEYTLFVMGGLSAWYLLKQRHVDFFTRSFKVALVAAVIIAPLQIYLGDGSGRSVFHTQPTKLGAMEAHWETNPPGQGASWKLLAWPNPAKQDNDWTFLTIPYGLSLLVTHSLTGQVKGLRDFPPEDQPPILLPFYTFRIMIAVGFGLVLLMLLTLWYWRQGWLTPERISQNKWLLYAWVAAIPSGLVAIETGWITREVGRQPWIIYGLLRTTDGATPLPAATVGTSLFAYTAIYTILFTALMIFAWQIIKKGPDLTRPVPGKARLGTGAWPWN